MSFKCSRTQFFSDPQASLDASSSSPEVANFSRYLSAIISILWARILNCPVTWMLKQQRKLSKQNVQIPEWTVENDWRIVTCPSAFPYRLINEAFSSLDSLSIPSQYLDSVQDLVIRTRRHWPIEPELERQSSFALVKPQIIWTTKETEKTSIHVGFTDFEGTIENRIGKVRRSQYFASDEFSNSFLYFTILFFVYYEITQKK